MEICKAVNVLSSIFYNYSLLSARPDRILLPAVLASLQGLIVLCPPETKLIIQPINILHVLALVFTDSQKGGEAFATFAISTLGLVYNYFLKVNVDQPLVTRYKFLKEQERQLLAQKQKAALHSQSLEALRKKVAMSEDEIQKKESTLERKRQQVLTLINQKIEIGDVSLQRRILEVKLNISTSSCEQLQSQLEELQDKIAVLTSSTQPSLSNLG